MDKELKIEVDKRKIELKNIINIKKYELKIIDKINDVIKEMDGKIFNKRFCDKISNDVLTVGENKIGYCYYKIEKNICNDGGYLNLDINCYHNVIEDILNKKENNGICNYNEYDDIGIRYIELNRIFDLTDSGKYRINADKFIEKFNVKKTSLKGEVESLEKALNEVETMIDDISNIICNMNKFNEKYPYLVQEIFGCYYQLSYEGSWNKKLLC